jgi:hypothetical protein
MKINTKAQRPLRSQKFEIYDKAVEEVSRKIFWERTNSAFNSLQKEPVAWEKELEERSAWDVTLTDGIEE